MNTKKSVLLALASLLLTSLYPCLFQYATNLPESRFADAMLFWGIFLGAGLLAFLVCWAILRRAEAAGFLACLCLLVLMNFGLIKRGIKRLLPRFPGLALLVFFAAALLALGVILLFKKWRCRVPLALLTLTFGALCLVSGCLALPKLISRRDTPPEPAQMEQSPGRTDDREDLPNIYFYLYDEYSGPESLTYYYNYDSSAFYEELERRGFSCSANSYNTESCATVQLVPNLYGLCYWAEPFQSGDGKSPLLYRLFQDMGYQVNLISHNDFLDTDGARELTSGQEEDSICVYLYQNSLFPDTPLSGPMEQLPQLRATYQYETLLQEALDAMESAWQETKVGPTLTLGYVQCPHTWFVYDSQGDPVPYEEHLNWEDPQYYLGQLEYTNQRILTAVDNILANDPGAIIILQSDHGARLGYHLAELYDAPYDAETDTIHQQNILNCVYLGGSSIDISGLSGINTLRAILNQVYGMNYGMVEQVEGFVNSYP